MGTYDRTPPLRAAVQSLLLYATLYGVATGLAAALCLAAWSDKRSALFGGALLAVVGFSAFNRALQTHVAKETGLRPRDAVWVLHQEYLRRWP